MAVLTEPERDTVPDFADDERARARYAAMLERRKQQFSTEHINAIRRNTAEKRAALRDEASVANDEWQRASDAANVAREAYRVACPDHVKRTRLDAPTLTENLRTVGSANRLYHRALDTWRAVEHAASTLRRIEHNENQLEIELKRALERAPATCTEVTASEAWLAEIHADEDLAAARARVEAIDAERADYARRLAAGLVSADERSRRTFAEAGIRPLHGVVEGLLFVRVETFDKMSFLIGRDLGKALYALPYDGRFEARLGTIYDIVREGDAFAVRRSRKRNTAVALTPLDHYLACFPGDEPAAREAYREFQRFASAHRLLATASDVGEVQAQLIARMLELAPD